MRRPACSLYKEVQFRQDCNGENWSLNYLSKKSGEEVDFLVTEDGKSHLLIEVKTSDDQPSKSFSSFKGHFTSLKMVQIAHKLKVEKTFPNGIEIRNLANWLSDW